MSALSSSRLRLLDERCPAALDLAEDNAPRDASVYAVGTVAHAVIDALHMECRKVGGPISHDRASEIAHRVGAQLALVGRSFDRLPEPPVPLAAVRPGVDIAIQHLAREGWAIDPAAYPELGLGVLPDWTPCDYSDPRAHWRAVIDLAGAVEDADGAFVAWTRDYKSSWATGPTSVQTLQIRGQALLLLAHAPRLWPDRGIDVIRREVVNLRSGAVYDETIDLAEGDHVVATWRAEIDAIVSALPHRPRPARPGPQCAGCDYRLVCRAAPPEAQDPASAARRYAALTAERDALEPALRAATEHEPMTVDGHVLGWETVQRREPAKRAAARLVDLYTGATDPTIVGLTARLISVSGIEKAIEALHPEKTAIEQKDALRAELFTLKNSSKWGFVKVLDVERKEKV